MDSNRHPWFSLSNGFLLAISLVISTLLFCRTVEKVKLSHQTITVKGFAEKEIHSDLGAWSATVSARAPSIARAYAKLEKDYATTIEFITTLGIPPEAIERHPVKSRILYAKNEKGYETNRIEAYVLEKRFSFESKNIERIQKITNESSELLSKGIRLDTGQPQYFYTQLAQLKLEMLQQAAEDALARAKIFAESNGLKVKSLAEAQQGVFQITPKNSTEISSYGSNDTTSIIKSFKAVVTMSYAIH